MPNRQKVPLSARIPTDSGTTRWQDNAPIAAYTELLFGGCKAVIFDAEEERIAEAADPALWQRASKSVRRILAK